MEELLSAEGNKEQQLDQFGKFEKKATVSREDVQNVMDKINRASLSHINKRISPLKIVGVRCTKPKSEKHVMMRISRKDDSDRKMKEIEPITLLPKYGFSEWSELLVIVQKHKGKCSAELALALRLLINKANQLNMVPIVSQEASTFSAPTRPRRVSHIIQSLLPLGSTLIDNRPPFGIDQIPYSFVVNPKGVFYVDSKGRMCFQRANDISHATIEHLFNLRLELMGNSRTASSFHLLISKELNKRRDELKTDEY